MGKERGAQKNADREVSVGRFGMAEFEALYSGLVLGFAAAAGAFLAGVAV
jgi:hypothetical protein